MGRGCSRQGRVARLVTVDFRGSIQGDHLRLRSSLLEVEPGGCLVLPILKDARLQGNLQLGPAMGTHW